MNLKSMTDFVLEQEQNYANVTRCVKKNPFLLIVDYAKFMKQTLTLGMFVPCDENGIVLSEPERWSDYLKAPESFDGNNEWGELYQYEIAKEKVLFDGFVIAYIGGNIVSVVNKLDANIAFSKETLKSAINKNIEWLVDYQLPLTESALKQIGIEKSTSGNTGQVPPTSTPNY